MRLFMKWQVSNQNVMRLAADAWVVFPDGVGRTWYLVDRDGAQRILGADSVFRGVWMVLWVSFLGLTQAGRFDPDWELAMQPLWVSFAALAIHLFIRKLRTIAFERQGRRRLPASVPPDSLDRIRLRVKEARLGGYAGKLHWIWAAIILLLMLSFVLGPDWRLVVILTMSLGIFDLLGPMEQRPRGGWGREGLEELWQASASEAGRDGLVRGPRR